mmetsp:Transcript_12014/g.28152  ORF Transcript_12014/g.28152 Transcript_12014/m.28152 type:complete len:154 (+) Transcript_12014:494-955(+)
MPRPPPHNDLEGRDAPPPSPPLVKSGSTRGYYAGVAVDPVKLDSLESFGSPKFVGDRVVSVERSKDGVLSADLVDSGRVQSEDGDVYYQISYINESTHGNNHYISRIAVRDQKLYVFTVQCKVKDYDALSSEMANMADSFFLKKVPSSVKFRD